jgi:hypothetical protein
MIIEDADSQAAQSLCATASPLLTGTRGRRATPSLYLGRAGSIKLRRLRRSSTHT